MNRAPVVLALLRMLLVVAAFAACGSARAALSCTTITSTGYAGSYQSNTTLSAQASFTITCNRSSKSDPQSIAYSVGVNDGLYVSGGSNNAQLGATNKTINYDTYINACGSTLWKSTSPNVITGTVTWNGTGNVGNSTSTQNFWVCVTKSQKPGGEGAYTDTVTMTATYDPGTGNTQITGQMPITLYAPAYCNITTAPGNINLTYPALSTLPVTGSTSFSTTCTSSMPYTLDVSPASGTLAGVNYTVTLSSSTATGSAAAQSFTVTVSAPSGQAGTCSGASCTASQTHTLTLTY